MNDIDTSGPMFDGRAAAAAHRLTRDIADKLGEQGRDKVLERLGQVIRHPTGYYESQVRTEARGALENVVTDGGVVYGPWLEGTSSRNDTTRFKGYSTFRIVSDRLQSESTRIIAPEVARAVEEMN